MGDRMKVYSDVIGSNIIPYDLRHSFALEFTRNNAGAFTLQKALGHLEMEITWRYVALADSNGDNTEE